MDFRSFHNTIAIVLSLCLAWHCVAGCCGHHGHSKIACGDHSSGEPNGSENPHSTCGGHSHENSPPGSSSGRVDSEGLGITFNECPVHRTCHGGKCSFIPSEKTPEIAPSDASAIAIDWCLNDDSFDVSSIVFKSVALLRPCTFVGATAARTQQLLCIWLI